MNSPRETIQISLGPSANAITAHLLNLQGLAATSSSSPDDVYCDPNTTHYVQGRGSGTLVPRVLMIDEAKNQVAATNEEVANDSANQNQALSSDPILSGLHADSFWNGNLQVLGDQALSATTAAAWNNGRNVVDQSRNSSSYWQAASSMAYSPYSRYHRTQENDPRTPQYCADPSNARHVVWDDDEEEEEEEEDPYERALRQKQAERRWKTNTAVDLGQELDRQIAESFQQAETAPEESSSPNQEFYFDHWTDIWMPPWSEKSKLVLPFSSQSQLVPHWNVSYQSDLPFLQEWKEDTLFENVRHMLEACDHGIQGVSISTEGHGMYASLATYLLDELKQECKSAGRLIYHVKHDKNAAATKGDTSWQEAKVDQIRKHVSSGLALYDFTEKAHAVLPLQLSEESGVEFFRDTAQIAMALEASTLPFRFSGKNNPLYQMGLQNAPFLAHGTSDTSWGATTARLTFSEYLQVLQPSSSYSMLELDAVSHSMDTKRSISNKKLFETLQQGTSVERDRRTRESRGHSYRTRPREVSPGSWMRDVRADSSESNGFLSSLSYRTSSKKYSSHFDRSSHHHFALSTSVRPILSSESHGYNTSPMSSYLTCLIEGMGIQYRPERSIATVLNQSLGHMTFGSEGGGNYGAGVYWKHIMPQVDTPVLAVLGNSTRAYTALNEIATDMKDGMKNGCNRGFYNRDVSNGVLPELEDSEEAIEACWNKRDVYMPPSGSGLGYESDY